MLVAVSCSMLLFSIWLQLTKFLNYTVNLLLYDLSAVLVINAKGYTHVPYFLGIFDDVCSRQQ